MLAPKESIWQEFAKKKKSSVGEKFDDFCEYNSLNIKQIHI